MSPVQKKSLWQSFKYLYLYYKDVLQNTLTLKYVDVTISHHDIYLWVNPIGELSMCLFYSASFLLLTD